MEFRDSKSSFTEISINNWSRFVYSHPNGNVFQTHEMHKVYLHTKNYDPVFITVIDNNDDIIGILLAVIQKEHSGVLGKFSSRSIIWGGPLIRDNNPDVLDFVLKEYKKHIEGKVIYSQFRNLWEWTWEEKDVFIRNGFEYENHLDILINLKKPSDDLLLEMHKGRRKNIRRAERIPLEFSEVEIPIDFEKCLTLIRKTYNKVKLPCPDRSFFINADKLLNGKYNLKNFSVKYEGKIISCRFVLCYNRIIYDWYVGTDDNHLDKYPNDFLPWKIMEWGIDNGFDVFDFGGAGKPGVPYGVRDYKLKFGGQLVNYGRFQKVHNNYLFIIGKIGLVLFKRLK